MQKGLKKEKSLRKLSAFSLSSVDNDDENQDEDEKFSELQKQQTAQSRMTTTSKELGFLKQQSERNRTFTKENAKQLFLRLISFPKT